MTEIFSKPNDCWSDKPRIYEIVENFFDRSTRNEKHRHSAGLGMAQSMISNALFNYVECHGGTYDEAFKLLFGDFNYEALSSFMRGGAGK